MTSSVNICGTTGTVFSSHLFTVENLGTPQLIQDGNLFCEDENPTIANLTANISNIVGNQTVIWHNAQQVELHTMKQILVNGTTFIMQHLLHKVVVKVQSDLKLQLI